MSVNASENVPKKKIKAFDRCLKENRGYYAVNPLDLKDYVRVHYEFDDAEDYNLFLNDWKRISNNVKETVRKYPWYVRLFRHIKGKFNAK